MGLRAVLSDIRPLQVTEPQIHRHSDDLGRAGAGNDGCKGFPHAGSPANHLDGTVRWRQLDRGWVDWQLRLVQPRIGLLFVRRIPLKPLGKRFGTDAHETHRAFRFFLQQQVGNVGLYLRVAPKSMFEGACR